MTTNNPTAPTNQVDEILKETEIGSLIARYKGLVIALVAAIVVGVFGWGIYSHFANKKEAKLDDAIFTFSEIEMKRYKDKKMDTAAFMSSLKEVISKAGSYQGQIPLLLSASDELSHQGAKQEALEIALLGRELSSSPYATYFFNLRMATLYEDLGKLSEAVSILESITNGPLKVLEGKTYLDLGRLYMAQGANDKARNSFQYVVDNSTENEFIKLAKLYLAQLP